MKAKFTTLLLALAVGAFAFAGCGGDDDGDSSDTGASAPPASETTESTPPADTTESSGGGGGEELKVSADPSGALKFDKTELEAKAGQVTLDMANPSSVPHAIGIEGNGVDEDGETVTDGENSTATANLEPGTYTFYCPVDGHEQAGMKGTLTVK